VKSWKLMRTFKRLKKNQFIIIHHILRHHPQPSYPSKPMPRQLPYTTINQRLGWSKLQSGVRRRAEHTLQKLQACRNLPCSAFHTLDGAFSSTDPLPELEYARIIAAAYPALRRHVHCELVTSTETSTPCKNVLFQETTLSMYLHTRNVLAHCWRRTPSTAINAPSAASKIGPFISEKRATKWPRNSDKEKVTCHQTAQQNTRPKSIRKSFAYHRKHQ
jgi:hypothetical protein